MIKNETRESAHLKSRVKDLSVVPNLVSFTGLFTAITPIAKLEKNPDTGLYDPILIRDTDSLIANFGDPRIDPEKYIDLYSIMQVVGNGTSCYVAKVDSGDTGIYEVAFIEEKDIITDEETQRDDINAILNSAGHEAVLNESDPKNKFRVATVSSTLSNKYVVSKLYGHIPAGAETPAQTAHITVSDPLDDTHTMTFRAKSDGAAGNSISVEVTLHEGSSDTFDLLVNDEVVLSDVADFETLESELVSVTVSDIPFVIESQNLEGGADATGEVEEQTWQLNEGDCTYSCEETVIDPPDPEAQKTFTLKVTTKDLRAEKIIIGDARLDPEYGREEIALEEHVPTGEDDKYQKLIAEGKAVAVYDCKGLARKYTIMRVTDTAPDEDPAVVGSDKYTVEWEAAGSTYTLHVIFADAVTNPAVAGAARQSKSIKAYSSMAEDIDIACTLTQAKPYSLKLFYLNVAISSNGNKLGTAKIKLEKTTTNQQLINNINSALQTYARFELADASTKTACEINEGGKNSIVKALLDEYAPYILGSNPAKRNDLATNPTTLQEPSVLSRPDFRVTLQNYIDAQELYKDRKYVGCLMADFAAPVTHLLDGETAMVKDDPKSVMPLDPEERRSLHYYLKQIACERKDATVILSTPLTKGHTDPYTMFTKDEVCDWVASLGDFADLWEYGSGNTTDYSIQSFYLEIYYSWLNMQCTKIENGLAKSVKVKVPPANVVVNNILTSWRERGVQYPVAGDQYGTLPDTCTIIQNPKTKLDRDQLVQYRINPIWDTGTRGIQIYGNETLNAGYTDLNAAHIARTLVYIRSRVDEYTETLKFLINSQILWDTWKNYVTNNILQPLMAANALSSYRVTMGNDTTSRAEIANRMIKGNIELTFYQSAEIFDLSFIVYSSATTVEEANPL